MLRAESLPEIAKILVYATRFKANQSARLRDLGNHCLVELSERFRVAEYTREFRSEASVKILMLFDSCLS